MGENSKRPPSERIEERERESERARDRKTIDTWLRDERAPRIWQTAPHTPWPVNIEASRKHSLMRRQPGDQSVIKA